MPIKPTFKKIVTQAPGRVCLFGDDFFEMNEIAVIGTISQKIKITCNPRKDFTMVLQEPDIASRDAFSMYRRIPYSKNHDEIRGIYNNFLDQGYYFPHGCDCQVVGKISMSAGLGSSEALAIAWTGFLLRLLNRSITPEKIATIAHVAEISAWQISNRFVDFLVISRGGLFYLNPRDEPPLKPLKTKISGLLICELAQYGAIQGQWREKLAEIHLVMENLRKEYATPDLNDLDLDHLPKEVRKLPLRFRKTIKGFLSLRNINQQAGTQISSNKYRPAEIGNLMNQVEQVYRKDLRITSSLHDKVHDFVLDQGALGAKIIGPNWGRMLLIYAPDNTKKIAINLHKTFNLPVKPLRLTNTGFNIKEE